jgi:hypothetical protein
MCGGCDWWMMMIGCCHAARCAAPSQWHAGFFSWEHTPTFRGFDSFLGFYGGGEDYFLHLSGAGSESPGPKLSNGYDFRWDRRPRCGEGCSRVLWSANTLNVSQGPAYNGSVCAAATGSSHGRSCDSSYSTTLFAGRAVQIVHEHPIAQPLFIYLAFQAVSTHHELAVAFERPSCTRYICHSVLP